MMASSQTQRGQHSTYTIEGNNTSGNSTQINGGITSGDTYNYYHPESAPPPPRYETLSTAEQYGYAREILNAARCRDSESTYERAKILYMVRGKEHERCPSTICGYRHEWSGRTALHYAAAKGWSEEVTALTKAGWDADSISTRRETPVYRAAIDGHSEVVRLLLLEEGKRKARLYVPGARSPFVAAVFSGSQECLDIVLEAYKNQSLAGKEETYLGIAHAVCLAALMQQDRSHPVDIRPLVDILESTRAQRTRTRKQRNLLDTALFYAARNGHEDIFDMLEPIANINVTKRCFRSRNRHNVLHEAVENNHAAIVRRLVHNEKLHPYLFVDMDDKTALDIAQNTEVRQMLEAKFARGSGRSTLKKTKDLWQTMTVFSDGLNVDKMRDRLLMEGYGAYPLKASDEVFLVRYIQWGAVAMWLHVVDAMPFAERKSRPEQDPEELDRAWAEEKQKKEKKSSSKMTGPGHDQLI